MSNKTTKKALLTSVISLVLCFAMLVGTTFAWFTDNVTSTGNRIISGNLDVDLVMDKDGDGTYDSIANRIGDIFSETGNGVKWEPGKTEIVYLGVKNKGNLALKYNIILDIVDGGLVGSLEYALINGAKAADLKAATKWADIKAANGVILGDVKAGAITVAQNGTLDEIAKGDEYEFETDYFALAVHMKEEAGNEYKNKNISIDVLVSATQVDAEEDSFGKDYDAGTIIPSGDKAVTVSSADELEEAMNTAKDGATIYMTEDITGDVILAQRDGIDLVLDGLNNTYSGVMTVFGDGRQAGEETFVIKNIEFKAANGAASCILSPERNSIVNNKYSYAHNVTVENCTFTDEDGVVGAAAIRQNDGGDKNWTIKNCTVDSTMHSLLQINNTEGKLTIDGCKVNSKNGVNLNSTTNVEIKNCEFDVKGYAVRFGVGSGGNPTEAKNFLIKDSTLKSQCDDGDAIIIFRASAVNAQLTLTNTTLTGTTEISGNTSATTIIKN